MIKDHAPNVYLAIEMLLANLAMQVNVKFNIEPHQAPDIAQTIYKQYYFYSIEEIALVLRMGSEGVLYDEDKTGKIFDRLSKDTIMAWFRIYDVRHRTGLVENSRNAMNKSYESESKEARESISNIWGKVAEKMKKEDDEKEKKEEAYRKAKLEYLKNPEKYLNDLKNNDNKTT